MEYERDGNRFKHQELCHDEIIRLELLHPGLKFDVHHIDGDGMNNDPSNLVVVPMVMHRVYHNTIDKNAYVKAGTTMRGQSRRKGIFKDFPNAGYSKSLSRFPRCFRSTMYFNGYQKSLGVYEDPLSASLVARLVREAVYD